MQEKRPVYHYKNITEQTQMLIGYGEVEAGETVKLNIKVENANFELVKESSVVLKLKQ